MPLVTQVVLAKSYFPSFALGQTVHHYFLEAIHHIETEF